MTENETIAATSRKGRETLEIINTVERLSAPNEVEMVTIGGKRKLVSWKESEYSQMKLVTISTLDEIQGKYKILLIVVVIFLVAFNGLMIFILYIRIRNKLHPLRDLSDAMEHFSESKIYIRYPIIKNDEIGQLTMSFNCMMNEIETLIEKEYKNNKDGGISVFVTLLAQIFC